MVDTGIKLDGCILAVGLDLRRQPEWQQARYGKVSDGNGRKLTIKA